MSGTPKFKGVEVELGNSVYVVPPLPLGAIEVFQERMAAFTGGVDSASVKFAIDITHAALRRNYPEMTREDVADLVDISTMGTVIDAVMGVSNLKPTADEKKAE